MLHVQVIIFLIKMTNVVIVLFNFRMLRVIHCVAGCSWRISFPQRCRGWLSTPFCWITLQSTQVKPFY